MLYKSRQEIHDVDRPPPFPFYHFTRMLFVRSTRRYVIFTSVMLTDKIGPFFRLPF